MDFEITTNTYVPQRQTVLSFGTHHKAFLEIKPNLRFILFLKRPLYDSNYYEFGSTKYYNENNEMEKNK